MKTSFNIKMLFSNEEDQKQLFDFAEQNGISFFLKNFDRTKTANSVEYSVMIKNPGEERQDYGSIDKNNPGETIYIEDKILVIK